MSIITPRRGGDPRSQDRRSGLAARLRTRLLYIGALGSRKTHAKRGEGSRRRAQAMPISPAFMRRSACRSARSRRPRCRRHHGRDHRAAAVAERECRMKFGPASPADAIAASRFTPCVRDRWCSKRAPRSTCRGRGAVPCRRQGNRRGPARRRRCLGRCRRGQHRAGRRRRRVNVERAFTGRANLFAPAPACWWWTARGRPHQRRR